MPQLLNWKRNIAAWTDATPPSPAEVGRAVTGIVWRVPQTIVGELRRRLNVLGLATKDDVAKQSKLGRTRVSHELKEFLEAQRVHDEVPLASLRAEIHEELQSLAAALDDDVFDTDDEPLLTADHRRTRRDELDAYDDLEDDLDDEIDLTDELSHYDAIE